MARGSRGEAAVACAAAFRATRAWLRRRSLRNLARDRAFGSTAVPAHSGNALPRSVPVRHPLGQRDYAHPTVTGSAVDWGDGFVVRRADVTLGGFRKTRPVVLLAPFSGGWAVLSATSQNKDARGDHVRLIENGYDVKGGVGWVDCRQVHFIRHEALRPDRTYRLPVLDSENIEHTFRRLHHCGSRDAGRL